MKRLILTILCLLMAVPCIAQEQLAWMGAVGVGSGAAAPAGFSGCSGDDGIACDTFDGGEVTCADDALSQTNCWQTWAIEGTAGSNTNVGTGLEGTYSKLINAADSDSAYGSYLAFTAGSPRSFFTLFYIGTFATAGSGTQTSIVRLTSSDGATQLCGLGVTYLGKWKLYSNGAYGDALATGPSADTTYCMWLDYVKNTASTGCSAYVSEATCSGSPVACTCSKGSAIAQGTTVNIDAARVYLRAFKSSVNPTFNDTRWDKIRVRTSVYGDNGD